MVSATIEPRKAVSGRLALDLVRLCRPHQWVKNCFILAPLIFSGALTSLDAWMSGMAALLSFSLLSSAVYCVNDVLDAASDRQHPRKRLRPIPSGRVTPSFALCLALLLTAGATTLTVLMLPQWCLVFGGLYLVNSLVYCGLLKHRVIIDVLAIAIGFVLRLLAGCSAVHVDASSWLLVCGFSLALLLGFGKRRLEIDVLQQGKDFRPVLQSYSAEKLNLLLGITATMCLLSYMLYTVSPQTVALHHTDKLVYTVPFVAYGVFRYLFKVQEGQYDGPVEVLLKDPVFTINSALWMLTVIAILYLPTFLGSVIP